MDFLAYLCVIVCSLNLVHSEIIIPPELRSHHATSGMEWEDFIEQIMVSLNVDAGDIEIEEQEPGQPPEPTLSPSFLNPNSSLMSSLINGSLGVSLLDLAEIEELPPTPEPVPTTPAPPTLAPVTAAPLPPRRFTQMPIWSTPARRAPVPTIPSTIQILGSNPIPAQTQIRDVEAKVPLNHGVLTLHYHSFIENSNTARSSSLTGQPPPDLFAPSSASAQPNNVTVGNQTYATPVNRSSLASNIPTEIPPPANPIQVQVGRLSQIGTFLNPTEIPLRLNPAQVQIGRLSEIGASLNPTPNPDQVHAGRLSQIGASITPTDIPLSPNPVQVQVGRLSQIGTSITPTDRPLSPNQVQVQIGRLSQIGTSITPTDRPLSPNPVQVQVGRLSQIGTSITPTDRPLPPNAAQVQVGRLSQIGASINPTERPPTPNPVQIQVGRLSQIGTTQILQSPTAAPELGPGTGRNIGQTSGSAQSQANSQAPLYHGILTLHYQSYLPLNSSQQSNESFVGAAATDGFSSGVSSLLKNTGNGGPSVSDQKTVSLTDPLGPLSSTGPVSTRAPPTSQNSGTLGGLSSLISTMIARNRVPASRRTNRIRLNPAVDSGVSRTPVTSSSQQNNSGAPSANVSLESASQTATAGVLFSNTSTTLLAQSNLTSINLGLNANGPNGSAIQFSSSEGIVSPVSVQLNQTQTIPTRTNNASQTPRPTNIVETLSPITSGENIQQRSNISYVNAPVSEVSVSQSPVQTNSSTATSTRITTVTTNSSNTNETVAEIGFSAQPISLEIFNVSQPNAVAPSLNNSAVPVNLQVPSVISSSVIANATETDSQFSSNGRIQNAINATQRSPQRSSDQATNLTRVGNFQKGNLPGNQTIVGQNASDTSTGIFDPVFQNSTLVSEIPSPNMANASVPPSEIATGILNPITNIAQRVGLPSNNMTENPLPGNVELSVRNASTVLDVAPRSQNSTADSQAISSNATAGSGTSTNNGRIVPDALPQNSTGDVELSQGNPRGVVQIPTVPRTATGVLLAGSGAAFRERPATSKSEMHLPGWKWSMQSGAPSQIPVNIVNILLLTLTSIVFLFH